MTALTLADLAVYYELGRLDLSDAGVRSVIRRLLVGNARLRAAGPNLRTASFRLRSVTADDSTLTGIASAYGTPYPVGGGRLEVIEYPAFRDSLTANGGTVGVWWEHGLVGGRPWSTAPIGVARVAEQPDGLHATFELFTDTGEARSIARAAKAGALRELSVGYTALDVAQDVTATGKTLERVRRADLIEVSLVVRAANPDAVLDAA